MPKDPAASWAEVIESVPAPTFVKLNITASLKRWRRPEKIVESPFQPTDNVGATCGRPPVRKELKMSPPPAKEPHVVVKLFRS